MLGLPLGTVLGALAFVTLVLGIGCTVADTRLQWARRSDRGWRHVTIFYIVTLCVGAVVSLMATIDSAEDNAALHKQVNDQGTAVKSATAGVDTARKRIQELQMKTSALSSEWRHALANASLASLQAARIMAEVERLNNDTLKRLTKTAAVANRAAQKAGVYRLPGLIASKMADALAQAPRGVASIACAPGLESACDDLGRVFTRAGWQAGTTLGASFWGGGGGGLDIVPPTPDPGGHTGIYVWYRPGREPLAEELADALRRTGTTVGLRSFEPAPVDKTDITISVIFVAR